MNESAIDMRTQVGQLATFLDTVSIALHRIGSDGSILWANEAELTMLGYSADEFIGQNIAAFHVDQDTIADILARLHRGESLHRHPSRMICRDGALKDVLIDSSAVWHEGRFLYSQCCTHDVTDVRNAEKTGALFEAIIESSDDAIISKDLNGTITSWNRGAERLFGYAGAEAIGRSVTMLIPPERTNEEPQILSRVRRGERIDHYETIRRHKNGTLLDISLTVSPILDDRGRVIGASKIARDVTERKRGAEERERLLQIAETARRAAEAANHAKDEFLAMLAHELRNPLSAIRNSISVALRDEARREQALAIANRQTDQLGRLVDDLLDVARITQGRVKLRAERVVLGDVLQRTVDSARALMDERGHSLTLTVAPAPIHVQADAGRIEQAVTNLLANAAKYTNPGGVVAVSLEQEGSDAVIKVRDNGLGIAPQALERVFDLFAQGDRALDRAQGGLGIGLTVVRRIAELHGGTAEAHSAGIGHGAEFVLRLPALSPSSDTVAAPPSGAPVPPGRQVRPSRVLVVEDQPDAAESLRLLLELLGHHVRLASDGLAAFAAAQADMPDLMLIDIGLPGMNGYELAQALRRDSGLKHVVLVALTGYGRPEDKARAMAAGFDYHLVKPVEIDALASLVQSAAFERGGPVDAAHHAIRTGPPA